MSIQEILLKFKGILKAEEIVLSVIIIVVSTASFSLGRISTSRSIPLQLGSLSSSESKEPTEIKTTFTTPHDIVSTTAQASQKESSPMNSEATPVSAEGEYVASKSGTKYHLPWCSGAKRIKETNKVWFKTKAEAEKAGYEPAANCKGI